MVVRLHCPDVLFDCDDCEGIDPLQVELGATSFFESGVESGPQFQDFKGKAWARGLCLFTRIRSGVPFTVTMLDLYGGELRPPEDIVLEPREQRRVEWRIDSTARTVDVRALTAGGAPVPGAKIYIHSATPGLTEMDWQDLSTHTTVGETGEARFANVFAPKISLQAQCKGYGTAWLVDQFVPPEGATFEFRLEKGRSIDVEVVDADGTARDVNRVALDQAARPVWAQHVAVGHYRIDDAPTGRVVLRADLVGRSYRVTHDTARPTARIEVPPLGSLSARWTIPLTAGQSYTLLVRGTGADGWSTYAWISDEARVSGGPSTIADIVPGDYEVLLRQGPGWTGENPPVSQAVRATVKAGEVTAVVLEP
jgi:hypothetical protein